MLEQIDLTKTMEKEAYRKEIAQMELTLARMQRACKEQKIPVIIIFEGFDAAGKGLQINKLIHPLDPRGFHVYAMKKDKDGADVPVFVALLDENPRKRKNCNF